MVLDAARREASARSASTLFTAAVSDPDSFLRTLDRIIEVGPDRLSCSTTPICPRCSNPNAGSMQKNLPPARTKLDILKATIDHLEQAGYIYIGMDHFARPEDELAVAQRNGTPYRNFQGYPRILTATRGYGRHFDQHGLQTPTVRIRVVWRSTISASTREGCRYCGESS